MSSIKSKRNKVLVGLSGGVDSAVSAYLLLQAGYSVEGVFMKNWSSTAGLKLAECPWLQDRQEALRVAAHLGIPLHTLDFEKQYAAKVMQYFFTEYKNGRTPNPDVMCNKEIKFKLLYDWAQKHGFGYLATGHYARIAERPGSTKSQMPISKQIQNFEFQKWAKENKYVLERSRDEFKDQTYFIYNIKPNQLPHLLFPIGGMKKTEVKKLAKKIGLPNANRKESMGLCFVGKVRLKDFLEQKIKPKPGAIFLVKDKGLEIKDADLLGHHQGLHNYTIGQRQGIKVGGGGPYFVLSKDLKNNILYVTKDPQDPRLEVSEVAIHSVNLLVPNSKFQIPNFNIAARYRHQGELVPCVVEKISKDHYRVKFKKPQRAIASGQSLVLYSGNICLGGGVIG
jgi:tRNA-specific 2-thiouridylase